ncbi:ABC transporter permease [Streptomyces sp. NPDC060194]|uniref:ABC transporter permease n=1 Tax=Streptomyces sp. NPDC060194 TaxID=3347069 RepID=UPI00364E923F
MSPVLDAPAAPRPAPPPLPPGELAALHGLTAVGARPPLGRYLAELWRRRHFVTALASARLAARYSRDRLGQLWQVLTPLLNAAVYYLVFGQLMGAGHAVPDYVPFLVTGVFVFTFTQACVMAGTRAISGQRPLVRALHFPRAALPVALCLQQFRQLLFSMGVLIAIVLMSGVPPTPHWILAVPALLLQALFNTGLALAVARAAARTPDLAQLMPFVLRTWMYASGVMFALHRLGDRHEIPAWVPTALQCNPTAVYIDLVRYALIDSFRDDPATHLPPHIWTLALGWALLALVGGFVLFWQAEESYGRD